MARSDRPRIEGANPDDLHRRWLAIAAHHDPLDIPRLFERVCDGRIEHGMERIAALSNHPSREAVRRQLLGLLSSPSAYPNATSKPFWLLVLMLLVRRARPSTHRSLLSPTRLPAGRPISYWMNRQVRRAADLLHKEPVHAPLEGDEEQAQAALRRALSAHAQGRATRVLSEALAAWRSCRAPRLAAVIATLDHQLSATQPPPPKSNRIRWFQERAPGAAPETLGVLLRVLPEAGPDVLMERLKTLIDRPADPRIARALWRLITDGPFDLMTPVGLPLLAAMMVHADPRAVEALRPAQARRVELRLFVDGVQEALHELPAPSAATRALIEALSAAFGPAMGRIRSARTVEAELLEAIYEAPEDNAPRAVYADWLLERKDPRGEFIMLQLKAAGEPLSPVDARRMETLASRHSARWLGPLSAVVPSKARVFHRGFLSAATLRPRHQRALNSATSDPRWRTVRAIDCFGFDPTPLLASPNGAQIEAVGGLSQEQLASIREAPELWRAVKELGCAPALSQLKPSTLSALERLDRLHTLRFGAHFIDRREELETQEAQELIEAIRALDLQHLITLSLCSWPNSWLVWLEAVERSGRNLRSLEIHHEINGTFLAGSALTRFFSDFCGRRTLVDHAPMQLHRGAELGWLLQQLPLIPRVRALTIRADEDRAPKQQRLDLSKVVLERVDANRLFWRPPAQLKSQASAR